MMIELRARDFAAVTAACGSCLLIMLARPLGSAGPVNRNKKNFDCLDGRQFQAS
jgi:hypothetical protein